MTTHPRIFRLQVAIFYHWGVLSGPSPDVRACAVAANRHPSENQPKYDHRRVVWAPEATFPQKKWTFLPLGGDFLSHP